MQAGYKQPLQIVFGLEEKLMSYALLLPCKSLAQICLRDTLPRLAPELLHM